MCILVAQLAAPPRYLLLGDNTARAGADMPLVHTISAIMWVLLLQEGNLHSPRACATAFPCVVKQGLLFVKPQPLPKTVLLLLAAAAAAAAGAVERQQQQQQELLTRMLMCPLYQNWRRRVG
jgi:hypothetical protein